MKIKLFIILLLAGFYFTSNAQQLKLAYKIDTTNTKIDGLYHFINDYMKEDSIDKKYWNLKYKNIETYNYNFYIDGIWKNKTPKWINKNLYVKLAELDTINDSLSYFKFLISNNDSVKNYANVYKYYITKIGGKYYLDNCRDYETKAFFSYTTKNIHFYCSPFLKSDTIAMINSSNKVDSLCKLLGRTLSKQIDYYMCADESEMNLICNIDIWDGRVGGITDMTDKIIICITNKVFYPHEFIHAILGYGTCTILEEGIASYYGGLSENLSYKGGLRELRVCYKSGRCNFDDLYAGKIKNLYNSNLTYAFSAAFTQYLMNPSG